MQNAFDDVACRLLGRNHHGVVALGDEVGAYEAWQDVGDGNVVVSLVGDLRQGFEILALHALRCAISRGDAQTSSASHRCDSGKMPPLSATRPVAEGGSDHAYEARSVGLHDVEFDVWIEFLVFVTRSRTMEIHVHATEFFCQLEELSRGFGSIDVDGGTHHLRWIFRLKSK